MKSVASDGCGCFPTGRHYAGIAHLLRTAVRGLVEEHASDAPWQDLPIALIDVETTGRDASMDRVVELGIAISRGGIIVERKNWLVNPGRPIPAEASAVHKITDGDVKDAPRFEAVVHEVVEALLGCIPAAYNAPFDRAFVHAEVARAGYMPVAGPHAPAMRKDVEWIDPLIWAREIQREERSR
jgi:DNA polymerase-3 subunit epsilon